MSSAEKKWLSSAECAERTGLTVRALRVYEREGLLEPVRSANGWRRYGPADLARLNAIVALKALGLTLAQIRTIVAENPPPLLRILEVQAEAWKATLAAAERALGLTETACRRLQGSQELSLDELCELIKSLDNERTTTMQNAAAVMRDLINERITPEEERAWVTWWARHPEDATRIKAYREEFLALLKEAQGLAESGADPKSPEAQQLVDRHRALLLEYGHAERFVRQLEWNAPVTEKWMSLGAEMRDRDLLSSRGISRAALEFMNEAHMASPARRAVISLDDAAKALVDAGADPASSAADEAVWGLQRLCADYGFGDAYAFARLAPFAERINRLSTAELHQDAWDFLARAERARTDTG